MLWDGSEEDGNMRSECEEDKALTVKMTTGTLTGKVDRDQNALCLKCMKLVVKYFFLAEVLVLGVVILDLDKNIFPWQTRFIWGEGGSSKITVVSKVFFFFF